MDRKNFKSALMIIPFALTLGLLILVQSSGFEAHVDHVSFAIGFLLILGFCAGRFVATFGLPELSGFLAVGVLCGPWGTSLLGTKQLYALHPFNDLALALIAIQAGAEISVKFLKEGTKSLMSVIMWQTFIILAGMTSIFFLMVYGFGLEVAESNAGIIGAAIIFSIVSVSKAPADTLAILGETKLKGSFANHVLGVVVLIDILVIILFQVALVFIKPFLIQGAFFDVGKVIGLFQELLSSLAAGFSVGLIFILWFWLVKYNARQTILFVILAAFGISSMCQYLQYDTMIVFISGGFIVSNMSKKGHALVDTVEKISQGVMIVFFATAGAMLDLYVLKKLWPFALVFVFGRILFTAIGTHIGHRWAGDNLFRFRFSFAGYISQAGVTLVLAQSASISLGSVGQKIAAIATAMVALNELIGPVSFKLAIRREASIKQTTA